MSLRFAYNTNGCAHHRLDDALGLIADAGYDGVALTLDIHHLDPYAAGFYAEARRVGARLRALGLGCVIETGARFLLDPRAKHEPTLVTADPDGRRRRLDFLTRALHAAEATGAETMSFWAGVPAPGLARADISGWLHDGLAQIVRRAQVYGVPASLEPEPGMAVETVAEFIAVSEDLPALRLALDTGHCLVTGEAEPAQALRDHAERLGTVSIEDMRRGVHVHLPFGEGDMDMAAVLRALADIGYARLACVELSRESHRADRMIPQSLAWLKARA